MYKRQGYTENGQLYAAASEIGDYTVTTADGSTKVASVESVPQTLTPSDWSLTLKLYQANEDFQNGIKGDKNANVYDIVKVQTGAYDPVDSETGELLPWIEISDDLTGASGVGTYTATITVPEDFDAETDGYVLNFDEVTEVYTVSLNGVQLPGANQNIPSVDVSEYLKPGINTLEVQVASGLFNAVQFYNTADSAAGLDAFSRDSTYKDWWSPCLLYTSPCMKQGGRFCMAYFRLLCIERVYNV